MVDLSKCKKGDILVTGLGCDYEYSEVCDDENIEEYGIYEIIRKDNSNLNKTTIKKELYKQKPKAELIKIQQGNVDYKTKIVIDGISYIIYFEVPVSDMGNSAFESVMEAKLLNRWIVK